MPDPTEQMVTDDAETILDASARPRRDLRKEGDVVTDLRGLKAGAEKVIELLYSRGRPLRIIRNDPEVRGQCRPGSLGESVKV
ncbi:hypothetical protein SHKM778_36070 [Streptomyces sp. KM77-8]|uniref:Uncharacterized protein n=1 Tax=Streptomyces haneummycinicus TaxID=3074435 RepID=A0AAT9HIU0_9ACTN